MLKLWLPIALFAAWAVLRLSGFEGGLHTVQLLALQEYTAQARDGLNRAGLDELLPYHAQQPDNWAAGSALYSRYPLTDEGVRVHRSGFRPASATVSVPGAPPVQLESVHPCAPIGPRGGRCWAADLADQPAASPGGPVRILLGDFNATLDHSALRHLIGSGYRDAADTVGAGFGAHLAVRRALVHTGGRHRPCARRSARRGDRHPPVRR